MYCSLTIPESYSIKKKLKIKKAMVHVANRMTPKPEMKYPIRFYLYGMLKYEKLTHSSGSLLDWVFARYLLARDASATSRDILAGTVGNGEYRDSSTGIQWAETRDAAKNPAKCGTAPCGNKYLPSPKQC